MQKKSKDNQEKGGASSGISRKDFLRKSAVAGLATQIPWFVACDALDAREKVKNLNLTQSVLDILFPSEGSGPGALDCYADKYIEWVARDENIFIDERIFILQGFDRVENYSIDYTGSHFEDLPRAKQEELLREIMDKEGESFFSKLLTLIFEALFTHPAYGGNPDEIAWSWVNHFPGRPGPTPELMYPQILKTIRED